MKDPRGMLEGLMQAKRDGTILASGAQAPAPVMQPNGSRKGQIMISEDFVKQLASSAIDELNNKGDVQDADIINFLELTY